MVVQGEGKKPQTKEFENSWRALYAHYSWLCQIKHSSRGSVMHDVTASTLAGKGYVVMALPNVRDEDIPVKAMVAIISLQRMLNVRKHLLMPLGFARSSLAISGSPNGSKRLAIHHGAHSNPT